MALKLYVKNIEVGNMKTNLKVGDTVDFNFLVGKKANLYMSPNDPNKFQLGDLIFEVIEDEDDGYRSSMDTVLISGFGSINSNRRLDEITIVKSEEADFDGFELRGKDNHLWLKFGTDNVGDYYPCFIYKWTPMISEAQEEIFSRIIK